MLWCCFLPDVMPWGLESVESLTENRSLIAEAPALILYMRLRSVSNWSSMSNSLICIHENGYTVVAVLLHFTYAKSPERFHLDTKWVFTVSLTYDGSSKENVPVMIQLMQSPSCPTTFLSVFRITWILKDKKIYTLIPVSHSHCYRHLSYCCLYSFCHIQSLSYLSTLFPFLTLCWLPSTAIIPSISNSFIIHMVPKSIYPSKS